MNENGMNLFELGQDLGEIYVKYNPCDAIKFSQVELDKLGLWSCYYMCTRCMQIYLNSRDLISNV